MAWYIMASWALLGAVYGSVVAFFNHRLLVGGWNQITPRNLTRIKKLKRNVLFRYAIHFIIDALALLLVAGKLPLLLGAATGMVITQKLLIVKYIKLVRG
ncbi:MAG: hypothetical protein U0M15_01525 [Bacillota bacterium]|nr:hypothetical protein [Bacillota bacterium]